MSEVPLYMPILPPQPSSKVRQKSEIDSELENVGCRSTFPVGPHIKSKHFYLLAGKGCRDVTYSSQFDKNYFTEMCSGSEAGSYLRLIDFLYHSTLCLGVMKKKTIRLTLSWVAVSAVGERTCFSV